LSTVTPTLLRQLGVPPTRADKYAPALDAAARRYGIDTPLRLAHWLSQVLHESAMLRYTVESASGWAYENRKDLGNTTPGDGPRFRGRGFIQLTGRRNYADYSAHVGRDLTLEPQLVADLPYCADVAGWFWKAKSLNAWADQDNIRGVTLRVNGGYNGLDDRIRILANAKSALSLQDVAVKRGAWERMKAWAMRFTGLSPKRPVGL
jgi:putative chitinase